MMHRLTDEQVWLRVFTACIGRGDTYQSATVVADLCVPEFRKRFPAPPKPNREELLKAMKGLIGGQDKETELTEPTK